jgi:hypothetical protein
MQGGRRASEVSQVAGSTAQRFSTANTKSFTAQDPEPVNCPAHTICGKQTSCTAYIIIFIIIIIIIIISTKFSSCTAQSVGRDSSVGIATRYEVDDEGIESRWGARFSDRPYGPPSLQYNGYRVSFLGVKRPGRDADHPPASSAEVKEKVQLYLYSSSEPSWRVIG